MGKNNARQPDPPDPKAVGQAQMGTNINTAIANTALGNANEYSPTGSLTYNQIGSQTITGPNGETYEVPRYERRQTLSPEQQKLYNQQTQLGSDMNNLAIGQTSRLNDTLGRPIDGSNLPSGGKMPTPKMGGVFGAGPSFAGAPQSGQVGRTFGPSGEIQNSVGPTDFSADRKRVEDAIYSRLNPQLDSDRAALESQLVNQGFARNSEAFRDEMDSSNRQATDARMQAILAGGGEQTRLADLAFRSGDFANSAQQQGYAQALGRAGFENAAIGQQFSQDMQGVQFGNDQLQRGYENERSRTMYGNDLQQQQFGNEMSAAQSQDTQRERGLQEMLALRNQPINEISALMNGGQVSMPQFAQYKGGNIDSTPIGQYMYSSADLAQKNYAEQMKQDNATMSGLYGLGSTAIMAGMTGGASLPFGLYGQLGGPSGHPTGRG